LKLRKENELSIFKNKIKHKKIVKIDYDSIYKFNDKHYKLSEYVLTIGCGITNALELKLIDISDLSKTKED